MSRIIDGNLSDLLIGHVPGHWQKIETGSTSQGVPDLNYCVDRCEGWIECKQTHGWVVKFRTGQVAWMMRRARAGGRVWVAVRRWPSPVAHDQLEVVDELWIVPGAHADLLAAEGLRSVAIHSRRWSGGPRNWDWGEVRRLLQI